MSTQFSIPTLSFGTPFCTSTNALTIDTSIGSEDPTQQINVTPFCTSTEALIVNADNIVAEPENQGVSGIRFLLISFASALIFSSVLSFSM